MPFVLRPCHRFLMQCLWIGGSLLLACDPIHAGLCTPPTVQKENPYHFLLSFAAAIVLELTLIRKGGQSVKELSRSKYRDTEPRYFFYTLTNHESREG